jgi:hypothetical protein
MTPDALTSLIGPYRSAMETATPAAARAALRALMAPDAVLHLCHPFGDLTGPEALIDVALGPLMAALPDLERRDMILVAGPTPEGADWVACMGSYMGRFSAPFLGIPPTGGSRTCATTNSSGSRAGGSPRCRRSGTSPS